MPATFKPELKADARKDGTKAVRIRITKHRKNVYFNLGKYVMPSHWNAKSKTHLKNWITGHPEAPQYNNAIKNALSGLEQISDSLPAATASGIKEAYEKHLNPEPEAQEVPKLVNGYFAFMDEYIEQCRRFNENTADEYKALARLFKKFVPSSAKTDADILSPGLISKYVQSMKGLSEHTIKSRLAFLSTVYSKGVKQGRVQQLGDPFEHIKIRIPEKKKARPTPEQIQAFIDFKPVKKKHVRAKQAALLQYYCHGARISEALQLEWDKNVFPDHIEYLPGKRGVKLKVVARTPQLNKLLEELPRNSPYVLPFFKQKDKNLNASELNKRIAVCTARVNKSLQEISTELQFDIKLCSHMFRHSLADKIMKKFGTIAAVKDILGHSSYASAENYVKGLSVGELLQQSTSLYDDE